LTRPPEARPWRPSGTGSRLPSAVSLTAVAIVLSFLGALFELTGLALVVSEIRSDRERGQRLLDTLDQRERPERTYPAPVSPSKRATVWEQVQESGQALERLRAEVTNALIAVRKTTDAELDRAMEAMQHNMARRDAELREGLRYVLAGSTRQRTIGVGLLGAGVVLAGAGSVVSNLT
jgi:hypothetical protein